VQVDVQLGEVVDPRHWRGPVALQRLHALLDARLLLRPAHQAEQRLEAVVTGQRRVTRVQPALAALEQVRHHRLGVVPPQLARHRLVEGERFHQPVQDRLGAFAGQGDGERAIRVPPGRQQHRHQSSAVREIDVDVSEVCFEPLARIVVERDEGLALVALPVADVQPHALVATGVVVLLLEPPPDLCRRVPLFARRFLIVLEEGVDDRLERVEDRRRQVLPHVGRRLRV